MTVAEQIDLTDKAFIASLPRPTGGELIVDEENHAIHGVALIGPRSRNDGVPFEQSSHEDFERIINTSSRPVTVQFGHFAKPTFDENGGIVNAYRDGNVLRGSHFLNPHKSTTKELLYNARHFKANQCYSVEAYENDLVYQDKAKGRSIVGAKGIKWFAVDRSCGTTDGMNQSLVREEAHKMAARPTKPEQIEKRYPDLYSDIVDKVRAEALAELNDQVTSDSTVATLESRITDLESTVADKQSEIDKLIAENEQRLRKDDVIEQWQEMVKDVDLSLLPDTEDGKKILALGELSDTELTVLASKAQELATGDLQVRLATIKNNLTIAESFRNTKGPKSFVDVTPADKTTVAAGIDLGGIKFGG